MFKFYRFPAPEMNFWPIVLEVNSKLAQSIHNDQVMFPLPKGRRLNSIIISVIQHFLILINEISQSQNILPPSPFESSL